MANAAAKKSGTARAQVSAFYRPFLILTNALYVACRWWQWWRRGPDDGGRLLSSWSGWLWESLPLLAVAGLQWYAYAGILDQAGQTRKAGDTSLVGGGNLDLLVVTLLVQYGAVLWTSKVYYLLLMVPVWGAYALYSTFFGGGNKKSGTSPNSAGSSPQESDPAVSDKRQKRADKRRQKWS